MTIVGTILSLPFLAVTKVVNFIWWEILFPPRPKSGHPDAFTQPMSTKRHI
jgi:hypothetical protein